MDRRVIKIFLSSPSDVFLERKFARDLIARLGRELDHRAEITAIAHEQELLAAPLHFQDPRNIPPPSESDIVIVVLWSRLGVSLPEEFRGAVTGRRVTGTEWEFENAVEAFHQTGRPEIYLFLRSADAEFTVSTRDLSALHERVHQLDLLADFRSRWIFDETREHYKIAHYPYRDGAEFESLLEQVLRRAIERKLEQRFQTRRNAWAPYVGLKPFGFSESHIFHGRTRARTEMRDQLVRQIERSHAFLLVLGASGSGKSSAVLAGLLPDLYARGVIPGRRLVGHAVLRPSEAAGDVAAGLAAALSQAIGRGPADRELTPADALARLLRSESDVLGAFVGEALAARYAGFADAQGGADALLPAVAIVLDQAEELFTLESLAPAERERTLRFISSLATTGAVWVIATLRSDFFELIEEHATLADLAVRDGQYLLRAPDEHEIGQIIGAPARAAGLSFEREPRLESSLDEVIRTAAARSRSSLPLLQHLLHELWNERTASGELTFRAYEQLGRLEGAIGTTAELTYQRLDAQTQEAFPHVLRELVSISRDDEQHVAARTVPLDRFPAGTAARALVDALCAPDARLLVIDRELGPATRTVVRVAHEAIFTHWPRASRQIADDRRDLSLRDWIDEQAVRWERAPAEDRPGYLVPIGAQLTAACDLLERRRDLLAARSIALITASSAAEDASRRQEAAQRARDLGTLAQLRLRDEQWEAALRDAIRALPQDLEDPDTPIEAIAFDALERCIQQNQLLAVFRPHTGWINTAAFSPDGALIASGDQAGAVLVWRADSGERLTSLSPASVSRAPATALLETLQSVRALRWSRSGALLARATRGGDIQVWDRATWSLRFGASVPNHDLWGLAFDAATTRVLVPVGPEVWAYSLGGDPLPERHPPLPSAIHAIDAAPEGALIAASCADGSICLANLADGSSRILGRHSGAAFGLAFSPDGAKLASVSHDKSVRLWEVQTGKELWCSSEHALDSFAVAFSADGERVVSASHDCTARIWSVSTGASESVLRGHKNWLSSVHVDPVSGRIATASFDGTVRFWRPRSGLEPLVFTGHLGNVKAVACAPDGRRFATASDDGTAHIGWLRDRREPLICSGHEGPVRSVVFTPDAAQLLTASWDGTARLWDASTGKLVREFRGHSGPVRCARVHPAGEFLATASFDKTVRIWNLRSGRCEELIQEDSEVYSLAFDPRGASLASLLRGGALLLRAISDGRIRWTAQAHAATGNSVEFSPSGRLLATSGDDNTAALWDTADGAPRGRLEGHEHWVVGASFHPSERWVVTASFDRTARIWDVERGIRVSTLRGHTNTVYAATFDRDGQSVITASHDLTARVWRARLDRAEIIREALELLEQVS